MEHGDDKNWQPIERNGQKDVNSAIFHRLPLGFLRHEQIPTGSQDKTAHEKAQYDHNVSLFSLKSLLLFFTTLEKSQTMSQKGCASNQPYWGNKETERVNIDSVRIYFIASCQRQSTLEIDE